MGVAENINDMEEGKLEIGIGIVGFQLQTIMLF